MQFVKHGPDVPEALLQAHEEGRVVFFCGAGISYPAGLPGFRGLVDQVYAALGTGQTKIEQEVYCRGQYDATLDLLERRFPGQRVAVRRVLIDILKPNLRKKRSTQTHAAILQLARTRDGAVRLVTTNFDRIFERVIARTNSKIRAYPAPLLPIPKNSRWDGLVYLHGLLPETDDETALQRLVLTSGDFGLAYLTEGWAARFVSELFRNFVICFVGYSINDPVLRYMMDAIAADKILGEKNPSAYAFGHFVTGRELENRTEWEAKNVVPILYQVSDQVHDHFALHRTLGVWADTYRDGVNGRERIVVEYAIAKPVDSTKQDDYVGRMLWALSHNSGIPAKRFADFNPAPSLDWLETFAVDRYRHSDLPRFGITVGSRHDDELKFSLLLRPSPYARAPRMALNLDAMGGSWDDVMFQLARWLTRHLNDSKLVIWLCNQGATLTDMFERLIEDKLDQISTLEREGKTAELELIRNQSPNAIPNAQMRIIWRLLLSGRVRSRSDSSKFFRWIQSLKRDGMTDVLRIQFREFLVPKVTFSEPLRWSTEHTQLGPPTRVKDLVSYEIVLAGGDVRGLLSEVTGFAGWRLVLLSMLLDFQSLLHDALDIMRELEDANDLNDRTFWDMPSISPHWQNKGFHEWVILIEFIRESWDKTLETNARIAAAVALNWFTIRYPIFKRLALYAATFAGVVPPDEWVGWLSQNESWWLWSAATKREVMRLLVLQGGNLEVATRSNLEDRILHGPPRSMYPDEMTPHEWTNLFDRVVWLRLSKLSEGCGVLGSTAAAKLSELSAAHPDWTISSDERDEFSSWMSGTGDPDWDPGIKIQSAPRLRRDLITWLRQPQSADNVRQDDDWRIVCLERFPVAACALYALSKESCWPEARWRDALQVWSSDKVARLSWRSVGRVVHSMPDDKLRLIVDAAAWWLESVSKVIDQPDDVFLNLCWRIVRLPVNDRSFSGTPMNVAINHPIGHVADALLTTWFRRRPNDNDGLPNDLKPLFTALCDAQVLRFRPGRVLFSASAVALFRVDRSWASDHLLPFFKWRSPSDEPRAAWDGFLSSPRLFRPLLVAIKRDFLETARHYDELGESAQRYASLLTYAALDPWKTFTQRELADATAALPEHGLVVCAEALVQALEGAGDQREEQWNNRIALYWKDVWPKSRDLASKRIAEPLARLVVAAGNGFPRALDTLSAWLMPLERLHSVISLLKASGLCGRFPRPSLVFLSLIVDAQPWAPPELRDCLEEILQACPAATHDTLYQRLSEYLRRHSRQ